MAKQFIQRCTPRCARRLLAALVTACLCAPFIPATLAAQQKTSLVFMTMTRRDYGDIYKGEDLEQVFPIRNDGEAALEMDNKPLTGMAAPATRLERASPFRAGGNAALAFVPAAVRRAAPSWCTVADFHFDKVLQPGQAGVIRIHIDTKDLELGPLERTYELQTNDPKHRLIQVVVTATIKPLPAFVKRISNADIQHGDKVGSFIVWPTARPIIPMEKGERLPISLRIRPDAPSQRVALAAASDAVKLVREANGDGYVLEMTVEPPTDAPSRVLPLVVNVEGGQALTLQVTAKAQTDGLVTSSRQVDFGEVSLTTLQSGAAPLARLGVRKPVGTFEVKTVTASLDFLRVEAQTIVPGSNYVIYIRFDAARLPKPATYIGTLHIATTDAAQPQLDVPVKVIVTK